MSGQEDEASVWRKANRANWDERVAIHLTSKIYDAASLRAGRGRLNPIEEEELGSVDGLRVLHLQCHMGHDSLTLAQRGAQVVGIDFSAPAIAAARELTAELGLEQRVRFIEADVYRTIDKLPEPHGFDMVFSTWGTIGWLPDIKRWAQLVAHFLKPGGFLYLADGHPAALVFDDLAPLPNAMPGYFAPYFLRGPLEIVDPRDYADDSVRLTNAKQYTWMHGLGDIVTSLIDAGLSLERLREHPAVPWRMFNALVQDSDGMCRWPDRPWLPLAFSLRARSPRV